MVISDNGEGVSRAMNHCVSRFTKLSAAVPTFSCIGRVNRVLGSMIEGVVPQAFIGEQCDVFLPDSPHKRWPCEVVGFTESTTFLSPLLPVDGISSSYVIQPLRRSHTISVGRGLLGRILDGFGRPLDGVYPEYSDPDDVITREVITAAPLPSERPRIDERFTTGVSCIDAMLSMGKGQRIGIFAGPGCGKTTLMASMARGSEIDVLVLALIGERGREVREFTEHELGSELREKTVVVCATSDRTAMERVRAAFTATAIAEGLRDQGLSVLLMVDSLTRLARAQREIGLATGEQPARGGFPPSVYALLPKLIERAGRTNQGSITAVYTVLAEGETMSDPISEEVMSLLDGHIILTRRLAEQGQYPAIDVLRSISRLMSNIVSNSQMSVAIKARKILSTYKDLELLIKLGEYKFGIDVELDANVRAHPHVMAALKQDSRIATPWNESINRLTGACEII